MNKFAKLIEKYFDGDCLQLDSQAFEIAQEDMSRG